MPLLFSLTGHNTRDDFVSGGARLIPRRAFSFVSCSATRAPPLLVPSAQHYPRNRLSRTLHVSDDTAAELQLGGYDPASVAGVMHMTPNIAREGNFAVKAFSIK